MKAVVAVLLTSEMTPATLAVSGAMIGTILLILGGTGWIDKLARLVPQSLLAGLQLGLGLALAVVALELVITAPVVGIGIVVVLVALQPFPHLPAAAIAVAFALLAGSVLALPSLPLPEAQGAVTGLFELPSWHDIERGFAVIVLPQLSLTLTNAIILTALVTGDYFGEKARHVTPRSLSVSSGLANLLLAPFGALPMCHGAGGVVAHHRFGARSGGAPLMLGLALLAVALVPDGGGVAILAAMPAAGLGALLLVTSFDLAISRRLFDCKASCYPVIGATAAATAVADPFWGLIVGTVAEATRVALVRTLRRRTS
jgi:MFS superfamily sulfate permease-like transporter